MLFQQLSMRRKTNSLAQLIIYVEAQVEVYATVVAVARDEAGMILAITSAHNSSWSSSIVESLACRLGLELCLQVEDRPALVLSDARW